VKAPQFEPAGHAFHSAALKLLAYYKEEENAGGSNDHFSNDKEESYMNHMIHIARRVKRNLVR